MSPDMFAKEEYLRLKAALRTDLMKLDQELIEHPSNLQTAAEICAEAIRIRDALDHELSITKAMVAKLLRNGSDAKPSEAAITAQLPLNREVQKAENAYGDGKLDAAMWQALVKSMEEKGSNLRRVCEMTMAGYLTPASVYQERREEMRRRPGSASQEKAG